MHAPAFSCLLEVDAENLKGVVRRMVGITQDASASLTSQLSAIRLIVGLERQIFHAAKEELLAQRAEESFGQSTTPVEESTSQQPSSNDGSARAPHTSSPGASTHAASAQTISTTRFEPVISVAIIKQLLSFLTGLIHNPEVSQAHAVRAGNLILSLQKLALEESKWNRLHANPKPTPSSTSAPTSPDPARRTRPPARPSNRPAHQSANQSPPPQIDRQRVTDEHLPELEPSRRTMLSADSGAEFDDDFGMDGDLFDSPTSTTSTLRKVLGELIGVTEA